MFHEIFFISWALLLLNARCSMVRDITETKGLYLEDYCPEQGACPEGTHVLCMYYTPGKVTGPRCFQPMNISMTNELATILLDITNAIRGKIASGKETGKGRIPLPRAYGMNKLKWDNELATLAQVMANQCILRHDLCRSTKRFPDPGQTAGLVRFTHPDWFPVSKHVHFESTGLTTPKLTYAATQALKSWYQHKDFITKEWIETFPDWTRDFIPEMGKLYLEIIYQKTTHMGCGIIAYTEYAYHNNNADLIYNSVQIICNFSARPIAGEPVYNTEKPITPGFTVRCGCPIGFDEDANCLCENKTVESDSMNCQGSRCKPAVILLPIFTVEDAPPRAPKSDRRTLIENSIESNFVDTTPADDDIFASHTFIEDSFDNPTIVPYEEPSINRYTASPSLTKPKINSVLPTKPKVASVLSTKSKKSVFSTKSRTNFNNKRKAIVKPRYFSKKHDDEVIPGVSPKKNAGQNKNAVQYSPKKVIRRQSIFSQAPKFSLPSTGQSKLMAYQSNRNNIPSDEENRRQYVDNIEQNHNVELSETEHDNFIEPIDRKREGAINKLQKSKPYVNETSKFNKFLKNKFHYFEESNVDQPDIKYFEEDADNKLMNLLDTLEQEVKHIELDDDKKELFDAKIRKIYGTLNKRNIVSSGRKSNLKSILRVNGADTETDNEYSLNANHIPVEDVEEVNNFIDKQTAAIEDRVPINSHVVYSEDDLDQDRRPTPPHSYLRLPAQRVQSGISFVKPNQVTSSDDEHDYDLRKNKMPSFGKNRYQHYSDDDLQNPARRKNTYKNKIRGAYKESSINREYESDTHDDMNFLSDNDLKDRPVYKNEDFNYPKKFYETDKTRAKNVIRNEVLDWKGSDKMGNSYFDYSSDEMLDDFTRDEGNLDIDRRRFYEEKLKNIKMNLGNKKDSSRRATHQQDVARRLVHQNMFRPQNKLRRPGVNVMKRSEVPLHHRKNKMNFYLPERTRSIRHL